MTILARSFSLTPDTGTSGVVASGVRNSQQRFGDLVVFMDIGGVTAEEINSVPLADILDTSVIENFGWGIRQIWNGYSAC